MSRCAATALAALTGCSPERVDTRAGHYERRLETKAGAVVLKIPKLRSLPFETAIIERYRRRESSVEEALVEMYLAGVSVRRVEDITEALWGTRVSSGTVSRLNQKIYRHIEAWRSRKIEGKFPYLFLDGVVLKRSWAGEVRNVSVLVAIGVGTDGHRQMLGVAEGQKEDLEGWRGFLRHLKDRSAPQRNVGTKPCPKGWSHFCGCRDGDASPQRAHGLGDSVICTPSDGTTTASNHSRWLCTRPLPGSPPLAKPITRNSAAHRRASAHAACGSTPAQVCARSL